MLEQKRFSALVSDMDGVLLDTEQLAMQAWRAASLQFDIALPEQLLHSFVGRRLQETRTLLSQYLGAEFPVASLSRCAEEWYETQIRENGVPVKAGAHELLEALTELKVPCIVATSTATELAKHKLERVGLLRFFTEVIGGDQVQNGKPAPDIYLRAAGALRINPKLCVAIEDSAPGVQSAHGAGMHTVMIPDLVQPDHETRARAALVLTSISALQTRLHNLFVNKINRLNPYATF